jgi:hypothetical protein
MFFSFNLIAKYVKNSFNAVRMDEYNFHFKKNSLIGTLIPLGFFGNE